jgi:hypothetical protein
MAAPPWGWDCLRHLDPVNEKVLMTRFQRSAVRFVAVVLVATIASVGCSGPPTPEPDPGKPGIPLDSPVGGSRTDFPVDGFDLCSPFTHWVFLESAPVTQAPPEHGPGSCRWRGEGVTATITDETGATLAEISHDPRYRPGSSGIVDGNRFWATASPTSPPYTAHLFLAAGPAQPRRLLHIHVESEGERAPSPQPGRSYTARGLATLIAESTTARLNEIRWATTAPAPR